MKTHTIILDEMLISIDDYDFPFPFMRFPLTDMKSASNTSKARQRYKVNGLKLSNDERELLKHVFIHGYE